MIIRHQTRHWNSRFLILYPNTTRPLISRLATTLLPTVDIGRHDSTMSSTEHVQWKPGEILSSGVQYTGQSGRQYLLKQVLQERGNPPQRVSLATYVCQSCSPLVVLMANNHYPALIQRISYLRIYVDPSLAISEIYIAGSIISNIFDFQKMRSWNRRYLFIDTWPITC